MVFSSLAFLYLFLPAVLILHTLAPKRMKNGVLLAASLLFYYIGEQELTLVMVASCLTGYLCARGMAHFSESKPLRRLFLGLSLLLNLSVLVYFKYANLFLDSFRLLTGAAVPCLQVALPIGVSFYTFQTVSYTVDVYRGQVPAERSLFRFATYVTVFPQLIAGPVVRYETVAGELTGRSVTVSDFARGVRRFCVGLGKKVILADTLARLGTLYREGESPTVLFAWLCAVAVPLQVYFDFSGYSDMAIGLGAMLGFRFPENFDHPYVSRSATEFWRRWHITLGTWFRDYLYIPLGGNRCGTGRMVVNLLIVWAATGLWHGAAYHFLLWGLFYGCLIVLEKLFLLKWLERSHVLSRIYFFLITVVGFEIFDADSTSELLTRLKALVGIGTAGLTDTVTRYYWGSYGMTVLLSVLLSLPLLSWVFQRPGVRDSAPVRLIGSALSVILLLVCTGYLVDGSFSPFLYFRF